ncbi:MAG: helix-turn-helix transcriptional regulator [Gammaproteobacteria bacterium]|nr:helix-turn-helix transcriptional regulator [Gammaproteobacteria bacterium]
MLSQRVKSLRKNHGWTLEKLSALSGVSRSMLSQIERGKANPTLEVTCRIARAFRISIGELVEEPWLGSSIKIIHYNDPTYLYRSDSLCTIRTLSPLNTEKAVEFYELTISPKAELRSAAHFDGTHELLTVVKGGVRVLSGTESSKLGKGDSAHYRADRDHVISNPGKGEAVCFLVVIYI